MTKERTIVEKSLFITLIVGTFLFINELFAMKFTGITFFHPFLDPVVIISVIAFALCIIFFYVIKLLKVSKQTSIILTLVILPMIFALYNYITKIIQYSGLDITTSIRYPMLGFVMMELGILYNMFSKDRKELIRNYIILTIAIIIMGVLNILTIN